MLDKSEEGPLYPSFVHCRSSSTFAIYTGHWSLTDAILFPQEMPIAMSMVVVSIAVIDGVTR